eukprot:70711-Pyramimonas_sp.AAC.2
MTLQSISLPRATKALEVYTRTAAVSGQAGAQPLIFACKNLTVPPFPSMFTPVPSMFDSLPSTSTPTKRPRGRPRRS